MWIICWFLHTEVVDSNPQPVCCVLEQRILFGLIQSTQLTNEYQTGICSSRVYIQCSELFGGNST